MHVAISVRRVVVLFAAFTLNGCEEKVASCSGRSEAECVASCAKVRAMNTDTSQFEFIECTDAVVVAGTVTCAVPPDGSEPRTFPSALIPRGWEVVSCGVNTCDGGVLVASAMGNATSAPPCCTRADCSGDDDVCFLGYCTTDLPGPCEEGTCPEGKGCAQNVQEHCEGCSNDSACVQPSVCELINGEACTLGTVQTDAQATEPVDSGLIDAGALCTTPADPVDPGGPYVGQFGCHAASYAPTDCLGFFGLGTPDCPGSGRDASLPEDLPCGSCDDTGYVCSIGVHAQCDCDGDGSSASFIDPNYWDQWGCMCVNGTWQCWILNVSGASCNGCNPQDDAGTSLP